VPVGDCVSCMVFSRLSIGWVFTIVMIWLAIVFGGFVL
jgi:hypothetical protein